MTPRFSSAIATQFVSRRYGGAHLFSCALLALAYATPAAAQQVPWALEATFDGHPSAPSQSLLPNTFDFVATHRTLPGDQMRWTARGPSFVAEHTQTCGVPTPINASGDTDSLHSAYTNHVSNGARPDESFFVCHDHMMSSMGDVSGYSVSAFWPRQEFDFADGGVLEFDTNINDKHPRTWFEVVLMPRQELKVGAAVDYLPIDETYPRDSIVLGFGIVAGESDRTIIVRENGSTVAQQTSVRWRGTAWNGNYYGGVDPTDPALTDRRIRRKHRVRLDENAIVWSIEKRDGTFHDFRVPVPGGLPLSRALVVFKTHAYTPKKDGNSQRYTFHWDNIRFDGPVVGRYRNVESDGFVYLQANGSRRVGEQQTLALNLASVGKRPALFGQIHNPVRGEVLLSINGGPFTEVVPFGLQGICSAEGWESFRLELNPASLRVGSNTFTWKIGKRTCGSSDWPWIGFSVKGMEVQFDLD